MSSATLTFPPPGPAPSARPAAGPVILVVDDSPVDRLVAARILEAHGGWQVAQAGDGAAALEYMARTPPAAVLTDLQMPRMTGLTLVHRVREQFPRVPVVLMTGHGSEEIAIIALRAGAASYVPKRSLATALVPALGQVLTASRVDDRRQQLLACLTHRTSRFTLGNDPALVGPLVAALREDLLAVGLCDPTTATRVGVALEEALLNAIYHGNLEVGPGRKRDGDADFQRTVTDRRAEAPYRDRRVRVGVRLTPQSAAFAIADGGPGFDVSTLPDPADPSGLGRPGGRGVVLMRSFMDKVEYNAAGNRVTLVKHRDSPRDRDDD